jgi:hypothetical protein
MIPHVTPKSVDLAWKLNHIDKLARRIPKSNVTPLLRTQKWDSQDQIPMRDDSIRAVILVSSFETPFALNTLSIPSE